MLLLLFATIFNPHSIKGSRSWLVLGPLRLQPAEFAKFATALALAKVMSIYGYNIQKWQHFAATLAIIVLPMLFIVLQRETGSALVYTAFFLVFYREGMPGSILFTGVAMVLYFVVGIRYADTMILYTPTSVGKFMVLLFIQLFSRVHWYGSIARTIRKPCSILAVCLGITLAGLLFSLLHITLRCLLSRVAGVCVPDGISCLGNTGDKKNQELSLDSLVHLLALWCSLA